MNIKLKALAAVAALSVSGVANAAVIIPDSDFNNNGGSELVLNIFDKVSGASFSADLGITFGGAIDGAATNLLSAQQMTDLTAVTNFMTGGTLRSDLSWSVFAADNVTTSGTTVNSEFGKRMLTTATTKSVSMQNLNVDQATLTSVNFVTPLNITGSHPTAANGASYVTSSADQASWMNSMGTTGWEQSRFSSDLLVGSSLFFLSVDQSVVTVTGRQGTGPGINTGDFANTALLGSFSLSTSGNLTYAPVPLPAAVWLFGAGLMGLVGVARRRRETV